MKSSFTTTLDNSLLTFLLNEAKEEGIPRNVIIERALKLYRKFRLQQQVYEGMKDRQQEYAGIAKEFMQAQNAVIRKAA